MIKLSGKDLKEFSGPARCFDDEREALKAIVEGRIREGDALVIRYQGPAVSAWHARINCGEGERSVKEQAAT